VRTYRVRDRFLWRQAAQRLQPLPPERVSIPWIWRVVAMKLTMNSCCNVWGMFFPSFFGELSMLIKPR
jgi:hypothetical protein